MEIEEKKIRMESKIESMEDELYKALRDLYDYITGKHDHYATIQEMANKHHEIKVNAEKTLSIYEETNK